MKKKTPKVKAVVVADGKIVERRDIPLLTPAQLKAAARRKRRSTG